jgi:hypothetical protein
MKTLARLTLLLLLALPVFGAATTAVVTWPIPTKYPDGTAFPITDVAFVTITWSVPGTTLGGTLNTAISPPTITVQTPCGKYLFTGTFTTTATAHVPSTTSNVATATYDSGIPCPTPRPPVNITIL